MQKFKNIKNYDGEFKFITSPKNIISFYEELKKEFENEIKPKRIFITENDLEEELWDDELDITKKQKLIDTNKPVILIDSSLLIKCSHKEYNEFKSAALRLLQTYKVAIIGIEPYMLRRKTFINISEEIKDIIFLEKRCYPINKEIIYIRDDYPVESYLSVYCCLDRYITSIWFPSYCEANWNKAYKTIIECVDNPPEIMKLDDDEGTCGYVI